jgi:hypothetical protein
MTTGMAAFTATAANAAIASSVTLSPDSDTAATGQCNPFTATVAPTGTSITVNIQQAVPSTTLGTLAGAEVIGFCQPLAANADSGPTTTTAGPGTAGAHTTPASPNNQSCTNQAVGPNTADNVSCNTTYTDTNNDGTIVFGVTSNTAGSMSVNAFGDVNSNGAQDVNEGGDTSAKTWVTNNPNANTDKVSCTPASASNPAGTAHNFNCTVTDANGNPLAGATNVHFGVASGPDAGAPANATCGTTADGTNGSTPGQAACTYTNNGQPGHDVINVWLEQNGTPGQQAGEPSTSITKDWLLPAPTTSVLSLDCSPTETQAASSTNSGNSACQEVTSQKDVTLTASVTNGSPAQPVSGVVVQFAAPVHSGAADAPDTDTESLSATSCTTDSSGKCSVTFTDTVPTELEVWTITASLPRQGTTADTAQSVITYHDPAPAEARNIAVTPKTASQTSGGVQAFTATVKDRFGNPVGAGTGNAVTVTWSESGPGAFRAGNTCTTGSDGTCTIEVTSLSSETGTETVTATIPTSSQCDDVAGTVNGTPNQSPAPAGNCTDSGQVTWHKAVTPPPAKTKITALINCFSPKKHVLKCKVKEAPAKAGLTVVFKRKTASGVHKIGVSVTNSNGVAKITKKHLKRHKIWRVFAHVRSTSTTTGATTGTDKTRIK